VRTSHVSPTYSAPEPDAATAVIGAFRIVRILGEGGTGVVYLGERSELFSQCVAIKVLHPEISLVLGDQLLHNEERILTSLDHPGIVRLLEAWWVRRRVPLHRDEVCGRSLDS
jgi:serine/threonine protein kinase